MTRFEVRARVTLWIFVAILVASLSGGGLAAAEPDGAESVEEVSLDRLRVQLRPMQRDRLEEELVRWIGFLQEKISEVGEAELARAALGEEAAVEALEKANELSMGLRLEEAALIERVRVVVEDLKAKGGDVTETEQYLAAVTSLESVDVSSRGTVLLASIQSWIKSPEGGVKFGKKAALALVILVVFWVLSRSVGRMAGKALDRQKQVSTLLSNFVRKMAGGVAMAIGILMALAALGVSVGPVLAAMGAGGFIIGFALQETLGNFASGLMIMIYRPFDVDDYVSVGGVEGNVEGITLVSTKLLTLDHKSLIIPNRAVWGDTITNYTGRKLRRVDLVFGIGYGDDIPKAMEVLRDVASSHEKVLAEPEVQVEVIELGDSSVNLACRPWVNTGDYWMVFWELTRQVKIRFDSEGISIPFPQRDVHMIKE